MFKNKHELRQMRTSDMIVIDLAIECLLLKHTNRSSLFFSTSYKLTYHFISLAVTL